MASFWSSRNFSGTRDAVLMNGLAMLAGCTSIVLAIILRPNDEAFGPGLGVALSVTGVLLVWSLTLAVRAWRRGERSGWCWAVMVLGGPETVLLGVIAYLIRFVFPFSSPFQWTYETSVDVHLPVGAIVLLPVGAIAYLVAAPVTWWRLRCAARLDAKVGIQGRSHWKRGLIWFCVVVALLAALLLPCPLFLYCSEWGYYHGGDNWRKWVVQNTPVFVADSAAGAVALSSHAAAVRLYHSALCSGRVSKKRLLAEVQSTDAVAQYLALYGLEFSDFQAALALADQIGQGRISGSRSYLLRTAGELMGWHGTPERIRYFLGQAATKSPPPSAFMNGLLRLMSDRPGFLPELASFCRNNSEIREEALRLLTEKLAPKELPGVWAGFLADGDPLRRRQAIKVIPAIPDANKRFAILAACIEGSDPNTCREMQQYLCLYPETFRDCRSCDPALIKRLVQSLLPALDDADRSIRWAAAYTLSMLVDDHGTLQKESHFFHTLVALEPREDVRFTPQEIEPEMVEAVRAATKKWINEHK